MKSPNLKLYQSIIFDCDGVILNSNKVKTKAFYDSAIEYGEDYAKELVEYHIANGGVSRYKKFEYLFEVIMRRDHIDTGEMEKVLNRYAENVWEGLLDCDVAEGLVELRLLYPKSRWLIVSGGDQEELRKIFQVKGIDKYFDRGIFGSPDDKKLILEREVSSGNIKLPAIFIGDSQYDFECAQHMKLDFIYLSKWSESKYDFKFAKAAKSDIYSLVF